MNRIRKSWTAADGWNAGARSSASFSGNGAFVFKVQLAANSGMLEFGGAVAGLNTADTGVTRADIKYGFQVMPTTVQCIEDGVLVGAAVAKIAGEIYKIQRSGTSVHYFKNGALMRTVNAGVPTADMFLDVSLYSGSNMVTSVATAAITPILDINATVNVALGSVGSLKAYSGASSKAFGSLAPTLKVTTGSRVAMSAPMPSVASFATTGVPNGVKASLTPTAKAYGGGRAVLGLSTPTVNISGTTEAIARLQAVLAVPVVTISGTTWVTGGMQAQMPRPTLQARSGAVIAVTLHDGYTVNTSGTKETTGSLLATLPMFELEAGGAREIHGSVNAVMPMMQPVGSAIADLVGPHFQLTAIGTAVVAVSYEAYAVNLQQSTHGREVSTNQVSHYTAYPFTQIVRYNGAYYGVGADGLYLLDGDTDQGAPIAWALETAPDDFNTKQQKRAVSMYIGGRVDEELDVEVSVAETPGVSYSYTTPRGDTAQNYRVKFGKGLKARYLAFKLSDPDGHRIEVDSLTFELQELKRAI